MSYNSNLGYADLNPYVVSGQFTNPANSSYAGSFGSNETQGGSICNNAMLKGGTKKGGKWQDSIRRKIKNITRKYKKMAKRRSKSMRKRLRSRYLRKTKTKTKSRNMKGGYTYKRHKSSRKTTGHYGGGGGGYDQFGSNITQSSGYGIGSTGGISALSSPIPVIRGGVEPNNYDHFKYSSV